LINKRGPASAGPFNVNGYKPVSRILYPPVGGWLSFIWSLHYCNDLAAYPSALLLWSNNWASSPHSLIYVALQHTRFTQKYCYQYDPWALTSRFHPYPETGR